ncbi:MAG: hypothetical protein JKY15_01980 [Deltaproteobacteria bacterium]|nr:hypothetical protein [Deltaproteobacteria bacterium]
MAVTTYDSAVIINRIISNLKLNTSIYNKKGEDDKIPTILFGDPPQQNWIAIARPYITVTPGEPFEISDEPLYVSKLGEESPKSKITLQFFITCVVNGTTPEDALKKDLILRKLLKEFFKNNPKMKDSAGNNRLFKRSRTTITAKIVRNAMDVVSAFTVVLQAEIMSA